MRWWWTGLVIAVVACGSKKSEDPPGASNVSAATDPKLPPVASVFPKPPALPASIADKLTWRTPYDRREVKMDWPYGEVWVDGFRGTKRIEMITLEVPSGSEKDFEALWGAPTSKDSQWTWHNPAAKLQVVHDKSRFVMVTQYLPITDLLGVNGIGALDGILGLTREEVQAKYPGDIVVQPTTKLANTVRENRKLPPTKETVTLHLLPTARGAASTRVELGFDGGDSGKIDELSLLVDLGGEERSALAEVEKNWGAPEVTKDITEKETFTFRPAGHIATARSGPMGWNFYVRRAP